MKDYRRQLIAFRCVRLVCCDQVGLFHPESGMHTNHGYVSLFYIPGTVGGAFVVDILGPKNTMVCLHS